MRDVEPVASPAFAIARRSEQTVDELFVGLRILVVDEGFDFRERGRQAMEIERKAADERAAIGFR